LGLHIIYNIVSTVLGGEIHVASIVGAGSTFTLKLPRQAPLAQA
jgi:signal transduction histidine kinase